MSDSIDSQLELLEEESAGGTQNSVQNFQTPSCDISHPGPGYFVYTKDIKGLYNYTYEDYNNRPANFIYGL